MSGWVQQRAVHKAQQVLARLEAEHAVLDRLRRKLADTLLLRTGTQRRLTAAEHKVAGAAAERTAAIAHAADTGAAAEELCAAKTQWKNIIHRTNDLAGRKRALAAARAAVDKAQRLSSITHGRGRVSNQGR
ncbi:hypothetical protein FOS14_16575 [Skermania sp. ID1734]|uniref:hypothetical protein n=1 Tax=Skermania sp. ID1734 TaxID=2597516 RepID=UPI00117E27F2|nr:hypothetical protein [Skermania sp. ID1734]TSD95985.1 hypothetical protein FOS14_16575 [Skermania sp. ID1734]